MSSKKQLCVASLDVVRERGPVELGLAASLSRIAQGGAGRGVAVCSDVSVEEVGVECQRANASQGPFII